jgi:hypothetical protein
MLFIRSNVKYLDGGDGGEGTVHEGSGSDFLATF